MTQATRKELAPLVRCMNVKYSPNLGDGLLSECLEAALVAQGAHDGSKSVDLAARETYGDVFSGRGTLMKLLDATPGGLRHLVIRAPLALAARRKWEPHYIAGLADADAIAIGGGNLLSDHDLNFPTKIALALKVALAKDLPVAFYACGMAGHWTQEGDRRLRNALRAKQPCAVFLRDAKSCERWNDRFADVSQQTAKVVRDPGLLAVDTYGAVARRPKGGTPRIGIGVMSHVAVRYHADISISEAELARWYVDLAKALKAQGADVVAFTNGAPEDRETAQSLGPEFAEIGVEVEDPSTPSDLSKITGNCDAITAFRMHAVIAAYSHGVPVLALRWDDKLDAFMQSVDRSDWIVDIADLSADNAAQRLLEGAAQGVDANTHDRVLGEARDGVRQLFQTLREAL